MVSTKLLPFIETAFATIRQTYSKLLLEVLLPQHLLLILPKQFVLMVQFSSLLLLLTMPNMVLLLPTFGKKIVSILQPLLSIHSLLMKQAFITYALFMPMDVLLILLLMLP